MCMVLRDFRCRSFVVGLVVTVIVDVVDVIMGMDVNGVLAMFVGLYHITLVVNEGRKICMRVNIKTTVYL